MYPLLVYPVSLTTLHEMVSEKSNNKHLQTIRHNKASRLIVLIILKYPFESEGLNAQMELILHKQIEETPNIIFD